MSVALVFYNSNKIKTLLWDINNKYNYSDNNMLNKTLDDNLSRYREKWYIFIKWYNYFHNIGGTESAHWVHTIIVSVINWIKNTAPVTWILVKSNTFLHWVQKVCQI